MRVAKNIWIILDKMAFILRENMLGYLSADIICSSKLRDFLDLRFQKTVRFPEQKMSADNYPSIFSRQIEAIVYLVYARQKVVMLFLLLFWYYCFWRKKN